MQQGFSIEQQSILVGSLLGDGYISKPNTQSYFQKNQSLKRHEYLQWHFDKLLPWSSRLNKSKTEANGKWYWRWGYATGSDPLFTNLRQKWYPEGKKIVPQDIKLDPLSIAIWFCDDGYNCLRKRFCSFATYCFQKNECEFLLSLLEQNGLKGYLTKENVIIFGGSGYDNLIDLIKPYIIWDCFQYKTKFRVALKQDTTKEEASKISSLFDQGYNGVEISKMAEISYAKVNNILNGRGSNFHECSKKKDGVNLSNTSGHKGLCWDKSRNRWRLEVKNNSKIIRKDFKMKEDAINWLDSLVLQ